MTFAYDGFIRYITESYTTKKDNFVERIYTLEITDYTEAADLKISVRNIYPVFSTIKDMLEGKIDFRQVKYRFVFALNHCDLPFSDVVAYTLELGAIEEAIRKDDK